MEGKKKVKGSRGRRR